jgi:hypothetical protein
MSYTTPTPYRPPGSYYNPIKYGDKKQDNDWEEYIGTMPSITGEQQAVNTPLSNYLAEALAGIGNQPTFDEWVGQGNVPPMFGGALGGQAQSAYSQALSGVVPNMFGGELSGEAMSAYAEALAGNPVDYNPSGANFLTNVIPAIKESYVGTGAIGGTEVGDRINLQAGVEKERIASIRASLYDQAKNRQAVAAGNYQQSWASMNEAVKQRQLAAASSYQQQWQNQLQIAYQNYTSQNPAASEILQAALNYLNIPMMGVYQKPV